MIRGTTLYIWMQIVNLLNLNLQIINKKVDIKYKFYIIIIYVGVRKFQIQGQHKINSAHILKTFCL